jgi:hypothetical protein
VNSRNSTGNCTVERTSRGAVRRTYHAPVEWVSEKRLSGQASQHEGPQGEGNPDLLGLRLSRVVLVNAAMASLFSKGAFLHPALGFRPGSR